MKSYDVQPDLTDIGLIGLAKAVRGIMDGAYSRVDLGHGTIAKRIGAKNKKYKIIIEMMIEEEE